MGSLDGIAAIIADTYTDQMREHRETPDVTPPPALEDIVDAHATQYGLQSDDAELLVALQAALLRAGCDTEAALVSRWKRQSYGEG